MTKKKSISESINELLIADKDNTNNCTLVLVLETTKDGVPISQIAGIKGPAIINLGLILTTRKILDELEESSHSSFMKKRVEDRITNNTEDSASDLVKAIEMIEKIREKYSDALDKAAESQDSTELKNLKKQIIEDLKANNIPFPPDFLKEFDNDSDSNTDDFFKTFKG